MKVSVKTPATIANLGCGFDSFGLALPLYNIVTVEETVLRKLFGEIAKNYSDRNGGYIRIYRMPPRRGDAAEMALIQLV